MWHLLARLSMLRPKPPGTSNAPAPSREDSPSQSQEKHPHLSHGAGTFALALGALGVVYGDIGTSPLYAVKECFHGMHAVALTEVNLLGVMSLIFWSLTMVVTIKYVGFILKADNHGEGGIFALLALAPPAGRQLSARLHSHMVVAAVFGAALLYGDGVITPAISVLSAVEGLEVGTGAAKPYVIPITCAVLVALFFSQHRGTASIGKVFGPLMILWFLTIGTLGFKEILQHPHILQAINPFYAFAFFVTNKIHGVVVLGSVVLCITGGEALYADLGHFGQKAIRVSWLFVAFPALLLNYFGQCGLLLDKPDFAFNPFYGLVPTWLLYPMVALSTVATVIASQAMISGVFSLTQQAIQLGYLPRLHVVHTSALTQGQIYIPGVNFALMLACIALVLAFGESSRLAGAYGIAVTATMGITSVLYYFVISKTWGWSNWKAVPLVALFLIFDFVYFGANLLKIVDGGWFTLAVATAIMLVMVTWRDGRAELARKMQGSSFPLKLFLEDIARHRPQRVPGTAVFMTISPVGTPVALLHHLKHNKVLHERVVVLSIRSVDVPTVPVGERLKVEDLGNGFFRLLAFFGFMEKPDVPAVMRLATHQGLVTEPSTTSYYLGRETLFTTGDSRMMRWRKALFAFMSRNASAVTVYFGMPVDRVIEYGLHIEL